MYKFIHEEQEAEGNLGRLLTAHHIKRVEIVVETDACLAEMCDAFQLFLKANGYNFEGNVEIVPEDGFEQDIVDYKSMQQDVTELNGDGNRERGRYGEDTTKYQPKQTSLWDAKPEEWDEASRNIREGKF
jgi:hypothetical protein